MRFLVDVQWDIEAGNKLAKSGALASKMESILSDLKPEAAYFTAHDGKRGCLLVIDLKDASQMPAVAEPWFLAVNATVRFSPAMTPQDLMKAGPDIERATKKFG